MLRSTSFLLATSLNLAACADCAGGSDDSGEGGEGEGEEAGEGEGESLPDADDDDRPDVSDCSLRLLDFDGIKNRYAAADLPAPNLWTGQGAYTGLCVTEGGPPSWAYLEVAYPGDSALAVFSTDAEPPYDRTEPPSPAMIDGLAAFGYGERFWGIERDPFESTRTEWVFGEETRMSFKRSNVGSYILYRSSDADPGDAFGRPETYCEFRCIVEREDIPAFALEGTVCAGDTPVCDEAGTMTCAMQAEDDDAYGRYFDPVCLRSCSSDLDCPADALCCFTFNHVNDVCVRGASGNEFGCMDRRAVCAEDGYECTDESQCCSGICDGVCGGF
jgi:hypothetical protein